MKDLMQDLMDAGRTAGAVALAMMIAAVVVFGVGGAANAHDAHLKSAPQTLAKEWKPGKRCKVLGKALTTHVSVMVERTVSRTE